MRRRTTATRTRRSPLSKDKNSPNSLTKRRKQTHLKQPTKVFPLGPDQGTMPIGMESTASTANSRITHRKIVSKESAKRNRAETNKDMPIGPKCM
jgi:hypothetical protein